MNPYQLHAWHLSYFAGKVRCYLRYKRIPFEDREVNAYVLMWLGRRKTGVVAMPLLRTPEGQWMQDSSETIEFLERRFPERPVMPTSPRRRFVAYWLEAWGDEWWIPIAMQTRWCHEENYPLFEHDAGNALLPGFPAPLRRYAVARVARRLRSYLRPVGVRAEQYELLMRWTDRMLDLLETHFSQHRYLMGDRPTLADFSLVATMYGHLGRDPWPARELIAPRCNLRAWIDRMANPPDEPALDSESPGDDIPATLLPILEVTFREFLPQLTGIAAQVRARAAGSSAERHLPRTLDDVDIPFPDGTFRRAAMPYTLWMGQRALDVVSSRAVDEQAALSRWIISLGGAALFDLGNPRLDRDGLKAKLRDDH